MGTLVCMDAWPCLTVGLNIPNDQAVASILLGYRLHTSSRVEMVMN